MIGALLLGLALQGAPALERDPAALPRAQTERWAEWSPQDPPPVELQPDLRAAMGAYGVRDYVQTLDLLYGLLEREPDFPPALYQAATAHFRMRRYGDCITLLERFVEVVPGEVGATQALGHSLYSLGRYGEAREHYEAVLEANPDSVEAVRGHALCHVRLGEPERGLELLRRVVELRETHADAHAWIAHLLFDEERLDEAQAAAERARELAPHEPRPWFLLSRILIEKGEEQAAEAARLRFEELSRLRQEVLSLEGTLLHDITNVGVLVRLVELYTAAGDTRGARGAIARLIRVRPTDVGVRILALDTLQGMGDREGARRAALDLEVHCAEEAAAWERLQAYYGSQQDRVRQIQAGERFLRLKKAEEERERERGENP